MFRTILAALGAAALLSGSAVAQDGVFHLGGDVYASGNQATVLEQVENDVFAAGFNASVEGPVKGDVHLAGFSVSVAGPVEGNVYAAGNAVAISGPVGEDVNAAGSNITLSGAAPIKGNARLVGANIDISKPIDGSLTSASSTALLNAVVGGDYFYTGESLSFGADARVNGQIHITSSSDISVPASVAPADRVTIKKVAPEEIERLTDQQPFSAPFWPGSNIAQLALTALILTIVGGLWLLFAPRRSEHAYASARAHPFRSLLYGVIGLAALFGLIFVSAISIIGLPLVPLVILILVVMLMLGYAAGGWYLGRQALTSLSFMPQGRGGQVLAMALGIAVLLVLGIIPFAGWIIQVFAIMFGLGGMARAALDRDGLEPPAAAEPAAAAG